MNNGRVLLSVVSEDKISKYTIISNTSQFVPPFLQALLSVTWFRKPEALTKVETLIPISDMLFMSQQAVNFGDPPDSTTVLKSCSSYCRR